MVDPDDSLVHTDEAASTESNASTGQDGSDERGADSSAVEHCFHTAGVGGSKPSPPTFDPLAAMLADEAWRMRVESRFWPKVMMALDWESCWTWKGAKRRSGSDTYGGFKLKSYLSARAHRVAYALYHGRSPGPLLVCHHCDNPECVNPVHLFLGTVQDNSDDMVRKGRHRMPPAKGEQNGAAKLSAADVEAIRAKITGGLTNVKIAAQYGVTHSMISRIRRGRAWGEPAMQPKYASLRR